MQRCVFCQTALNDNARFCRACGRMQPSSQPAASSEQTRPCPNCGEALPLTARFCGNCGRSLSSKIALAPGMSAPELLPGAPSVPGASAGAQSGGFSIPHAPTGPQSGGFGSVPGAPAGPQGGFGSVPGMPAGPQSGAPGVPNAPAGPQTGSVARLAGQAAGKAAGRSVGSKLLGTAAGKAIATVVAVAVVATGAVGIAAATGHNPLTSIFHGTSSNNGSGPTATPLPPPPELTYIGSDGNIWDMTLPQGTPKQLTKDAAPGDPDTGAGGISYSGLAWSPDGKRLAVLWSGEAQGYELRILSPDGTVQLRIPVPFPESSFAWSPDSRFIAYHQGAPNNAPNGDLLEEVVIADASTGAATRTLTYDNGIGGCGGGGWPAIDELIWTAHLGFFGGIDTFDWSSDGQEILAPVDCGSQSSALINLNTGTSIPCLTGASFQPGGQVILGSGGDGVELINLAGKQVRILANYNDNPDNPVYANDLGQATWSSDGKTIYYEYQDSIWRINVDGSGARQIIAGTKIINNQATVELAPRLSPDGKRLLYLEVRGDAVDSAVDPAAVSSLIGQWYIAQPDGTGAVPLAQANIKLTENGLSGVWEVVWRPET